MIFGGIILATKFTGLNLSGPKHVLRAEQEKFNRKLDSKSSVKRLYIFFGWGGGAGAVGVCNYSRRLNFHYNKLSS